MKKLVLLIGLLSFIAFSTVSAASKPKKDKAATEKTKASKPIVGAVASFAAYLQGKDALVKKDQAVKLASEGSPIVLLVGTGKSAKVYFVLNSDGTSAAEKLAKFGNSKKVGVTGKIMKCGSYNYIMSDIINSMD